MCVSECFFGIWGCNIDLHGKNSKLRRYSKAMKKKMTTVAFKGTPEQEEKLLAVIAKYDGMKGATMPLE